MKVLVVSHSDLAKGAIASYKFIASEALALSSIVLDDQGVADFRTRLTTWLDQQVEPVIVLADLKGGTPFNEAYNYFLANPDKLRVVSGVNLPMLLELVPQISTINDLDQAVSIVLEAGRQGIQVAENISEDDDDLDF